MNPNDFQEPAAGTVRLMPSAYHAFVPNAPPATLDYNAIVLDLSAADAALSELAGLGRMLPNPHLLIRPYVRREAAASTKIEGTQATLGDLYVDELAPEATAPDDDVIEIRNYVKAIEIGRSRLATLPIAGRLVREVHAVVLDGARGQERRPGEFRTSQNWIGGRGPSDAKYVPPPPDELWRCIGDWERFVNQRDVMPDLVQCALMHAHFESIHPFLDGNGRVGRLLMTLFLLERGRLNEPLLYVSSYIERHKTRYYSCLQRTRTHGDWIGWLRYLLEAVRHSARTAVQDAATLIGLRESLSTMAALARKPNERRLIDVLFANPYVTIQRAKTTLDVATGTAIKAVATLESLGVLHETTGRSWGRVWVATPILRALQGSPT